jgi:hypothetical protein
MYGYRQLREALTLGRTPLLSVFEQYCIDMGGNTRVFEWSCKITGTSLEGARFVHSSLSSAIGQAQRAVDRVYSLLFPEGEPQEPGQSLFYGLRPLARQVGERFLVAYAQQGEADDKRSEIKVYVLTGQAEAITGMIEPLVPQGALPPAGTQKVMIAASMDDKRTCRPRVYYMWDRASLMSPGCLNWLDRWCTPGEVELLTRSRNRAVSISFKEGRRDMLYWTAPVNHLELNDLLIERLAHHPMVYRQLGHLRHIGLSKRGEGLASEELNLYFNSFFG